jgi:hypothetical protein
MKIAFLASAEEDYLSDSVLHGLRSLFGQDVVDFPKAERLYRNCPEAMRKRVRGGGFTLYGLLEDADINRHNLYWRIEQNEFDLIIIGDIYREFGGFVQLVPRLDPKKTAMLDGADVEAMYPYAGKWWRHPRHWLLPRANRFLYFKRELTARTLHYRCFRLIPEKLCQGLPMPRNIRPTAFSIPAGKILTRRPAKRKLFPTHIVDPEVARHVPGSSADPPFSSEAEYYGDLQESQFGITTKRSGWDCLRHYELAANGCVPCFRNLNRKPATCAPHGLTKDNCILYQDYADLKKQIGGLSDTRYEEMQDAALEWARQNTTVERAKEVLRAMELNSRR